MTFIGQKIHDGGSWLVNHSNLTDKWNVQYKWDAIGWKFVNEAHHWSIEYSYLIKYMKS